MTKVFISYAHTDENYRKELEKHLSVLKRNNYIDTWTDREIVAGQNWGNQISKELEEAKVILLLISSDFLASNYCYDIEMKKAIERHNNKEAFVVPIILRYCDWSNTPFSVIQGLPVNAKPIRDWSDQDQAFLNIVDGIKILLNSISNSGQETMPLGLFLSPENKLSQIRRKVLAAENERDLRLVGFELQEYKKQYPISFEVEELDLMIKKGIRYEVLEMSKMEEHACMEEITPRYSSRRRVRWIILFLAIVIISILTYLIIRLFK